jgi:YVTN family beta-propeller protein
MSIEFFPSLRTVVGPLGAALAAALIIGVAVPQAAAAPIGDGGFVYTANELDNSVSRIDLTTGEVLTIPTAVTPHNVQITPDGETLLAVGTEAMTMEGDGGGHDGEAKGILLVFDVDDLSAGPSVQIEVGEHPAHVIADKDGKRAFVTNSEDGTVTVVDLATASIVGTIPTGSFPHGMRMNPAGDEIYVANVESGSVSVLDPAELKEVAQIAVGNAPVQVGFTPDGKWAFVSLRDDDSVAAIDPEARSVVERIAVGDGPIQVYATPDGAFVLVANQGTEEEPSDTVSVIEVATSKVVQTIRAGAGAHGVAVNDNGQLAFITNILDGTVSVIDIQSWSVIATIPVGAGPNGVTFGR